MKNIAPFVLLLFNVTLSGMIPIPIPIPMPIPIVIHRGATSELYTVEEFYTLYERSASDIVTKNVLENLPHYIRMMRNHIDALSNTIDQQNIILAKKSAKSAALLTTTISFFGVGSWMLYQLSPQLYEKNKDFDVDYIIGGLCSLLGGIISAHFTIDNMYDAFMYKKRLAYRYELGKKILAQLEDAQEA